MQAERHLRDVKDLKKSKEEEEEEEEIEILMSHLCSSQSEILRIWDCFSFGPEAVVCSLSSSFGCLMDKAAQRRNFLVRSCLTTSEQIFFLKSRNTFWLHEFTMNLFIVTVIVTHGFTFLVL